MPADELMQCARCHHCLPPSEFAFSPRLGRLNRCCRACNGKAHGKRDAKRRAAREGAMAESSLTLGLLYRAGGYTPTEPGLFWRMTG